MGKDNKNGKDKFYKKPKPKVIHGGKELSEAERWSKILQKYRWRKDITFADAVKEMKSKFEQENRSKKLQELRKKVVLPKKTEKVVDISTRKSKQLAGLIPKEISKKAMVARVAAGTLGGWAGLLYGGYELSKYAAKKAREKRQKIGTKHLGSKKQKKAYGGKVDTYRSPRRTTYND